MTAVYDALIRVAADKLAAAMLQASRSGISGHQITVWAVPPDDDNRKNGRLVVTTDNTPPTCPVGKMPTVIRPRGNVTRQWYYAVPYSDFYSRLWDSCRSGSNHADLSGIVEIAMTLSVVSSCALEVWRASGARTKERLTELVAFYADSSGETAYLAFYTEQAVAAIRDWELTT